MEKIDIKKWEITEHEGMTLIRNKDIYEVAKKVNEIIDWINDHKDQLLNVNSN
jgi:hypothetical protein